MLTEVNDDLYFLCEEAVNEIVNRILDALGEVMSTSSMSGLPFAVESHSDDTHIASN